MVKGNVCLIRIYAFMCFINNQDVPFQCLNFFQFVILSAKIEGTLQVLKRYEFNQPHFDHVGVLCSCLRILVISAVVYDKRTVFDAVYVADKEVPALAAYELLIVSIP